MYSAEIEKINARYFISIPPSPSSEKRAERRPKSKRVPKRPEVKVKPRK